MGIRFQTDIKVNLKAILKDCEINVTQEELKRDIRGIVLFWAERRLMEDGWPMPNSTKDIRDHLIENGTISEVAED